MVRPRPAPVVVRRDASVLLRARYARWHGVPTGA